ncbi:hypothetical protein Peur_025416 [Populus x canadensis]
MMDLWAVHVKNTTGSPLCLRNHSIREKSFSFGKFRVLDVRVLKRNVSSFGYHSLSVKAMAKKNGNDNSKSSSPSPSGNEDGSKGSNSSDGNKANDFASQKSHRVNFDWREFRANLFAQEKAGKAESDAHNQTGTPQESKPLGLKWAHPIPVPETGCVLVATEKLDGVRTFERTVVLLLRSGTRHPQEGPFGVVINRPLNKKVRHMKPTNMELATTFADFSLHFGGPLEASMFLLKTGEKTKLEEFEEVIPGLCFGARNSLDEAAALVKKGVLKPQDFRFFVGYAGWQLDQLREEIESDYWYVAACSSNLICGGSSGSSSESLWEEILQLMGGHYSELSRKPKRDA